MADFVISYGITNQWTPSVYDLACVLIQFCWLYDDVITSRHGTSLLCHLLNKILFFLGKATTTANLMASCTTQPARSVFVSERAHLRVHLADLLVSTREDQPNFDWPSGKSAFASIKSLDRFVHLCVCLMHYRFWTRNCSR